MIPAHAIAMHAGIANQKDTAPQQDGTPAHKDPPPTPSTAPRSAFAVLRQTSSASGNSSSTAKSKQQAGSTIQANASKPQASQKSLKEKKPLVDHAQGIKKLSSFGFEAAHSGGSPTPYTLPCEFINGVLSPQTPAMGIFDAQVTKLANYVSEEITPEFDAAVRVLLKKMLT